MQFEQCDVVVQRLRIVIVMDVGGGHPQRLGAGGTEFLGQVVITNSDVNGVSGSDNAKWKGLYI